jgi:hypothetical protein
MYPILRGLGDTMILYGVLVIGFALLVLLFEKIHQKKRGALPKVAKTLIYVGVFVLAALIAIPVQILKVVDARRKTAAIPKFVNPVAYHQKANEKQIAKTAQDMAERMLPPARNTLSAAERERNQQEMAERARERHAQALRQMEEQRARREAEIAEADPFENPPAAESPPPAKTEHEARFQAAQNRHATVRRQMAEMRAMREADFYQPPAGSTTPEQKALDAKIIAANAEYQELKAEQARLDTEYASIREERSKVMKTQPIDSARLNELSTRLHETAKARSAMFGKVNGKRSEVTTALNERHRLDR